MNHKYYVETDFSFSISWMPETFGTIRVVNIEGKINLERLLKFFEFQRCENWREFKEKVFPEDAPA